MQEFNAKQIGHMLQNHIKDCTTTAEKVDPIAKETDELRARVTFQGFRLRDLEAKIERLETE